MSEQEPNVDRMIDLSKQGSFLKTTLSLENNEHIDVVIISMDEWSRFRQIEHEHKALNRAMEHIKNTSYGLIANLSSDGNQLLRTSDVKKMLMATWPSAVKLEEENDHGSSTDL